MEKVENIIVSGPEGVNSHKHHEDSSISGHVTKPPVDNLLPAVNNRVTKNTHTSVANRMNQCMDHHNASNPAMINLHSVIRPAGKLNENVISGSKQNDKRNLCERHNTSSSTQIFESLELDTGHVRIVWI